MKWRIVGFNHPTREKSIVYKQNLSDEQLLQTIKTGIAKGCNLFSIRGFSHGYHKVEEFYKNDC